MSDVAAPLLTARQVIRDWPVGQRHVKGERNPPVVEQSVGVLAPRIKTLSKDKSFNVGFWSSGLAMVNGTLTW